jgi:hypothetical protein
MPSRSLLRWQGESSEALDEIEAAHTAVGGSGRGRRYATQQINQAYVVMLSSRFQQFCRDIHSEIVSALVASVSVTLQPVLQKDWTTGRKLDQGNPNPGNIGHDFARIGMKLWDDVHAHRAWNSKRHKKLELLMEWRNAVGHQDFAKPALKGKTTILLNEVQQFRAACGQLAASFDAVALAHIRTVVGQNASW